MECWIIFFNFFLSFYDKTKNKIRQMNFLKVLYLKKNKKLKKSIFFLLINVIL